MGGSRYGKTNSLSNLISHQSHIDKIYLYDKDPYEIKYQLQINKLESTGLEHYSSGRDDIYKNIEEYNSNKQRKMLIIFDDMIAYMLSNNKSNPIVTVLFIRGRKLNISIILIKQSYFAVPKNSRLNSSHYFIMKIPNEQELGQFVFNDVSDIDFDNFMNLYKKCTAKQYSSLVIDATLASDNLIRFRENLLEKI